MFGMRYMKHSMMMHVCMFVVVVCTVWHAQYMWNVLPLFKNDYSHVYEIVPVCVCASYVCSPYRGQKGALDP